MRSIRLSAKDGPKAQGLRLPGSPREASTPQSWLLDVYNQIFRSYVFGPSGFWTMAPLCYASKFDPFLSLDCAGVEGVGAQSKAIWQPCEEGGGKRKWKLNYAFSSFEFFLHFFSIPFRSVDGWMECHVLVRYSGRLGERRKNETSWRNMILNVCPYICVCVFWADYLFG